MRNKVMIGAAALLLASATFAVAQDQPQQDNPQPTATPAAASASDPGAVGGTSGSVDIGGRYTKTDGDEARYERYRDLRSGVNANGVFHKETENWTLDVAGRNIGYRDGRYQLFFNSRRVTFSFKFDQTPLNYGYYTRTPYDCTAGSCALDAGLRGQVQAKTPGVIGVPSKAADLAGNGSSYNAIANEFDLRSRRDTIAADLRIAATDNLDFTLGVTSYKRSGNMPFGAGFAFNNASELPIEIDNRATQLSVGVEWASHQGMFRFGYEHSNFDQNIPSFTFDNPQFATDFCKTVTGQAPNTCYDPSGYSNGNGPAKGRMAQPPSWTLDTFNWAGMVKLPGRTSANASVSVGTNRQDEALIPWTTNSSVANENVYAAFPGLAELGRDTADMRVNYTTATMNVRSKPHKWLSLNARYRYNNRLDFTRPFDAIEYVRFDAVPEETGGETEPLNINRNTFDANATFSGLPMSSIRVGYGYDKWLHTIRAADGWQDNTARVSFDTIGLKIVTLRAMYEYTQRKSIGFSEDIITEMGMQPAARFYDEASRNRNRVTVMAEANPVSSIGINASVAYGKDDYQGADKSQEFGLLDNNNTAFTVGVNFAPDAKISIGADYSYAKYASLMASRNANPAPDPQWKDPNRNWNLDEDEKVNTISVYANLLQAVPKLDVRLAYDYSDSNQAFVHSGPRIPALAAVSPGQFVALPDVTEKWHRASLDVRYSLTKKIAVGAYYLYEKFDVEDFATLYSAGPQTLPRPELGAQTDTVRTDWLGGLTTGYAARPYTGSTGILRVIYQF